MTIEELAMHEEEVVEFHVNDGIFYHADDLAVRKKPRKRSPGKRLQLTKQDEEGGENDKILILMTPSSFMSPTK